MTSIVRIIITRELRAAAAALSGRRFALELTDPELIYLLGSEQNDATTNGPVMVTATYRNREVLTHKFEHKELYEDRNQPPITAGCCIVVANVPPSTHRATATAAVRGARARQ